jgi:hypothetical protein
MNSSNSPPEASGPLCLIRTVSSATRYDCRRTGINPFRPASMRIEEESSKHGHQPRVEGLVGSFVEPRMSCISSKGPHDPTRLIPQQTEVPPKKCSHRGAILRHRVVERRGRRLQSVGNKVILYNGFECWEFEHEVPLIRRKEKAHSGRDSNSVAAKSPSLRCHHPSLHKMLKKNRHA